MTLTKDRPEILAKIESKGHWVVNIRPDRFVQERITLPECEEVIEKSSVMLRGWDYPHFNRNNLTRGLNYAQCVADFWGHIELWRYFQSGQFFHKFSCVEDWDAKMPQNSLEIIMTLYRLTEIFEFAIRLAKKELLGSNVTINIVLNGMQNRRLATLDFGRSLFRDYECTLPSLPISKTVPTTDLISHGHDMALDTTVWIFQRFGWMSTDVKSVMASDQQRFLKGLI